MLRPMLAAGVAAVALAQPWPADVATAATLIERTLPASDQPGSRARDYTLALPDGLEEGAPVPVVMVLHGCLQTQRDMIDDTRFVELADREGFIAVFPFVTSFAPLEQRNPNCWGFWFDQHQHEGRGEPGDLRRILAEVEVEFAIDPERRYVVGLSSGAAMAVVMAVAYSEDFAAAGSVAGLPYDETACAVTGACFLEGLRHKSAAELVAAMTDEQSEAEEQRLVPIMVVHSSNDGTVPFKNGQNIRDVWIARYGASTEAEERSCTHEGVACKHSVFRDGAGRTVVETVFYDGPPFVKSHAWIGDNAGQFADPNGPSATDLLWAFFEANPRTTGPAVQIGFDPVSVDGLDVTISGTVSGGVDIAQVSVRLEGTTPQPEKVATGTETWSARFEDLPDNQHYRPVARVEPRRPLGGRAAVRARQSDHQREGPVQRAHRGRPDRAAAAAVRGRLRGLRCALQQPVLPVRHEPVRTACRQFVRPLVRGSDPHRRPLTDRPATARRRACPPAGFSRAASQAGCR